jgi:hypothetical protein
MDGCVLQFVSLGERELVQRVRRVLGGSMLVNCYHGEQFALLHIDVLEQSLSPMI